MSSQAVNDAMHNATANGMEFITILVYYYITIVL